MEIQFPTVVFDEVDGLEKKIELVTCTKMGENIEICIFIEFNLLCLIDDSLFESASEKGLFCKTMSKKWKDLRKYFFKNPKHTGTQFFLFFFLKE